jgi:hypothetical protein
MSDREKSVPADVGELKNDLLMSEFRTVPAASARRPVENQQEVAA